MKTYTVAWRMEGVATVDAVDFDDAITLVDYDLAFWRGPSQWLDCDILNVEIDDKEAEE